MSPIVFGVLFFLAAIAVAACIQAFFIWVATRIVAGFKPLFEEVWRLTIGIFIISGLGGGLLGLILIAIFGKDWNPLAINLFVTVTSLLVTAVLCGKTLEHPITGPIGFGKGLLVWLVAQVFGGVFFLVFFVISALVAGRTMTTNDFKTALRASHVQGTACWSVPTSGTAPASPSAQASPTPIPPIATLEDAKKEAVRRYPQLGVAGSNFNVSYVARYARYQREQPRYFLDILWPVSLAEETAKSLKTK